MKIAYQVSDGYVGHGPLHCTVDDSEIQACESLEEAQELVEDYIDEDFRDKVSPTWKVKEVEASVEKIWSQRELV